MRPVGSTQTIPVDVRVISATHRDLERRRRGPVSRGSLLPAQRGLAEAAAAGRTPRGHPGARRAFLRRLAERYANRRRTRARCDGALVAAPWPGNVRQLLNVLEQARGAARRPMIPASLVQQRAQGRRSGAVRSRRRASRSSGTIWCGCSRSPAATSPRRRSSPSATAPSSTSCCNGTGSSRRCSRRRKASASGFSDVGRGRQRFAHGISALMLLSWRAVGGLRHSAQPPLLRCGTRSHRADRTFPLVRIPFCAATNLRAATWHNVCLVVCA